MSKPLFVSRWRIALRDSDLDPTAKLIGHTLSTYMNNETGRCHPSKETLAAGAGLKSSRAADRALLRIVAAGLLEFDPSRGGHPNTYQPIVPSLAPGAGSTAYSGTGSAAANPACDDKQPRTQPRGTPYPGTPELGLTTKSNYMGEDRKRSRPRAMRAERELPTRIDPRTMLDALPSDSPTADLMRELLGSNGELRHR